jgi:hypothetical protein
MKELAKHSNGATAPVEAESIPYQAFQPRYARPPEAAWYAGVCPRTFQNWMKRGVVPYRKIGRCVLVDLGELDQALARFKRNAIAPPRKRRAGRVTE